MRDAMEGNKPIDGIMIIPIFAMSLIVSEGGATGGETRAIPPTYPRVDRCLHPRNVASKPGS